MRNDLDRARHSSVKQAAAFAVGNDRADALLLELTLSPLFRMPRRSLLAPMDELLASRQIDLLETQHILISRPTCP